MHPTINIIEPDSKNLNDDLIQNDDSDKLSVSSGEISKQKLKIPAVPQKLNTLKIANIRFKGLDENVRSTIKFRK